MITRIIYTNFWLNSVQENLSLEAQHLYIYLITCQHIGICSIFRLPDEYILLESKLNPKQLESAKQELERNNKARFYKGWVYVINAEKFVNYKSSPLNQIRYLKDISFIPEDVITNMSYIIDTTIDTNIDTSYNTRNKNLKDKNINTELIADEVDKGLND